MEAIASRVEASRVEAIASSHWEAIASSQVQITWFL